MCVVCGVWCLFVCVFVVCSVCARLCEFVNLCVLVFAFV